MKVKVDPAGSWQLQVLPVTYLPFQAAPLCTAGGDSVNDSSNTGPGLLPPLAIIDIFDLTDVYMRTGEKLHHFQSPSVPLSYNKKSEFESSEDNIFSTAQQWRLQISTTQRPSGEPNSRP